MEHLRKYVFTRHVPRGRRPGWSLIEFFAGCFVLFVPFQTFQYVAPRYGGWSGVVASLVSFVASLLAVVGFYWLAERLRDWEIDCLLAKYPYVYRVKVPPTDMHSIVKPDGNDITVGDYGWEAEPIHDNGLIYLQGLREDWQVAWYAGFQLDQIERVGAKPRLQYYLPYTHISGVKPPKCPFTVRCPAKSLGHPIRIIGRWVQGVQVSRRDQQNS